MTTLNELASLRFLHPGELKPLGDGNLGLRALAARTGSFGFLSYQINLELSTLNFR